MSGLLSLFLLLQDPFQNQIDDAMSWRAGLLAIASDDRASMADRLHAAKVLLEAEDPRIPDLLRELVDRLPGRTEEEQQQVSAFLLAANTPLTRELLERGSPAYVYSLLLGAQTPFEHSTHADKFIYEAELRTGMGAHFRYAEHLSAVLRKFFESVPEARDWVVEGTAEPE